MGRILVAYASRYGATQEIAEAIATTLRDHELVIDVRPAAEVEDLGGYDAVVLGGGIYIGRWHRDARGFVKHFEDELSRMPVVVFGDGPVTDKPEDFAGSTEQLRRNLQKLPVKPIEVGVFGGAFDPTKAVFPFNHMAAADVRDWDAIRAWADGIAARLASAPALA